MLELCGNTGVLRVENPVYRIIQKNQVALEIFSVSDACAFLEIVSNWMNRNSSDMSLSMTLY